MGRRLSKRLPDGTLMYYVYIGDDLAQELDSSGAVIASYTYDGLDQADQSMAKWINLLLSARSLGQCTGLDGC
ncbi:MAG: hypothetical protein V9G13_13840 [Marmoricola sp.]